MKLAHAMQFLYEQCSLIFGGEAALKQYPSLNITAKTVEEAGDADGRSVHLQCFAWLWKCFGHALERMAEQYDQVLREHMSTYIDNKDVQLYLRFNH